MPVYQFSLLIQAAGTGLLLVLFVLVYQKIRLSALREWIVSWAFLLAALGIFWFVPPPEHTRYVVLANHAALLLHAFFLLRGILRLREEKGGTAGKLLYWVLPILGIAWVTSDGQPRH